MEVEDAANHIAKHDQSRMRGFVIGLTGRYRCHTCLEELKNHRFPIHDSTPQIRCKTYEDNVSCVKLANEHKSRPRTKHFAMRLHHFRSCVVNKQITVEHVSTKDQLADTFTKPLPKTQFNILCNKPMGW